MRYVHNQRNLTGVMKYTYFSLLHVEQLSIKENWSIY